VCLTFSELVCPIGADLPESTDRFPDRRVVGIAATRMLFFYDDRKYLGTISATPPQITTFESRRYQ
jgi:hypothetical protein